MNNNLKEHLTNSFNENIVVVNGVEYINLNVFQSAISEIAILDSILATLVLKNNSEIVVYEEELINYMTQDKERVEVIFDDKTSQFIVREIKSE